MRTASPENYPEAHLAVIAAAGQELPKKSERAVMEALLAAASGNGRPYRLCIAEIASATGFSAGTVKAVCKGLPREIVTAPMADRYSGGTTVSLATVGERETYLLYLENRAVADVIKAEVKAERGFTPKVYANSPSYGRGDGLRVRIDLAGLTEAQARRLVAVYAEVRSEMRADGVDDE